MEKTKKLGVIMCPECRRREIENCEAHLRQVNPDSVAQWQAELVALELAEDGDLCDYHSNEE